MTAMERLKPGSTWIFVFTPGEKSLKRWLKRMVGISKWNDNHLVGLNKMVC